MLSDIAGSECGKKHNRKDIYAAISIDVKAACAINAERVAEMLGYAHHTNPPAAGSSAHVEGNRRHRHLGGQPSCRHVCGLHRMRTVLMAAGYDNAILKSGLDRVPPAAEPVKPTPSHTNIRGGS
ncbi:hypothetical protein [Mesorhizobium sp. M0968]|uniref:hypothetical protein n=1 Tax=Mesorhizobium sp. M0968 TaxID=2957037 RepID=UPI003336C0A1